MAVTYHGGRAIARRGILILLPRASNLRANRGEIDDDRIGVSNYDTQPCEYVLSSIATTIEVDTRISDLFRSPMDQLHGRREARVRDR